MKRSPWMKLFFPKLRAWIEQWNMRTLYESGKLAQLVAEMRRYRLEILGVSESKLGGISLGKPSWQRESFSYTQGKRTKVMSMRKGSVSCYQGMRRSA